MPMINASGLSRQYQKGKLRIPALQDVSFQMEAGMYLSIVGKSGSGKSTLLNLIGALDRPTSGSMLFDGHDMAGMSRLQMALHRRYAVGMIFQSFNLISSRTALENVELALAFGGMSRRNRRPRAIELLSDLGLGERINHRPDELSGGEAQRVAIARALANKPRLLLADEPTGNLDSETSAAIISLLEGLNKTHGLSVIMVTHDLETAQKVSDQIIRLKDGRISEIL